MADPCFLGIDLGTGKVALAVVDTAGQQLYTDARPHHADRPAPAGQAEQDAGAILTAAEALLAALPADLCDRLAGIGLTGQMHGVVQHDHAGIPCSPLVTWQDRRASGLPWPSGYGLATVSWWAARGLLTAPRVATIHGLLAARLCGLDRAPIDPSDGQAWGGLTAEGVPADVMPLAVAHGAVVGRTRSGGPVPAGLPVYAPLGDNQASLRATLADPARELAFTIGTGCQLSAVVPVGTTTAARTAERRPYDLLVGAPLAGGAAWRWLAETARSWCVDLGGTAPALDAVYARLDTLGLAAVDSGLELRPHLGGERHDPRLAASLGGLRLDTGSLGQVARALAFGIAANARDLLGSAAFTGRTRVVASGNALRRSALLRREAERAFALPLVLTTVVEEAATGAALVARAGLTP